MWLYICVLFFREFKGVGGGCKCKGVFLFILQVSKIRFLNVVVVIFFGVCVNE